MDRSRPTPFVTVIADLSLKGSRTLLDGILAYAREHGPWRFLNLEGRTDEPELDAIALKVSGVIASSPQIARLRRFHARGIPCVLTDHATDEEILRFGLKGIPVVSKDSAAIGKLAADFFLQRRYSHFAFIPDSYGRPWSDERRMGFQHALAAAGFTPSVYRNPSRRICRLWHLERPRMIEFLRSMQTPCAVFAANDARARLVMDACAEAGLSIPEKIAVLGVDNDDCICQACNPPLSSISTGGFTRGYEAARILDALISGRKIRNRQLPQEPSTVYSRQSTAYGALHDPLLCKAYFFIRDHANARQISVRDVVRAMNCSRRYAEVLFKEQIGLSIKSEIDRVRFDRVKELLRDTSLSAADIAAQCNFTSEGALSAKFRRKFGYTLHEFRQNRAG